MSVVSNKVRVYIEKALREEIAEACPGYNQSLVERIVRVSMDGLHVHKEVIYRAIELADQHADAYTNRLRDAAKAAFILIREQLDNMDDDSAEETMNALHDAIEGEEE